MDFDAPKLIFPDHYRHEKPAIILPCEGCAKRRAWLSEKFPLLGFLPGMGGAGFMKSPSGCSCTPPGSAKITGCTISAQDGFTVGGTPANITDWIDGTTASGPNAWFGNGQTSGSIRFDFGAGAKVYVDKVKFFQGGTQSQGLWILEGSDDASSWTQHGPSSFDLSGSAATNETSLSPSVKVGYRYYRLRKLAGTSTSSTPFIYEIQFSYCTC